MIFFSHPITLALKFHHFPVFLHKGFNQKIKTVKKKTIIMNLLVLHVHDQPSLLYMFLLKKKN